MTLPVKQIGISINRSPQEVYRFVSNPENLSKWAGGLAQSTVTKSGDEWLADSPMGKVRIKFAKENSFGVLDHDVTLASGEVFHNPMRAVPNGNGSEVTFTLFRLPAASDEDFKRDTGLVETDLKKLKSILEK